MNLLTAVFGHKEEAPVVEVKRNDESDRARIQRQALAESSLNETIREKGATRFGASTTEVDNSITRLNPRELHWAENAREEAVTVEDVRSLIRRMQESLSVQSSSSLVFRGDLIDQLRADRSGWPGNYELSFRIQCYGVRVKIEVEDNTPYYNIERYAFEQYDDINGFNFRQSFREIIEFVQDMLFYGVWIVDDNEDPEPETTSEVYEEDDYYDEELVSLGLKSWDDADIVRLNVIPPPVKRWDDTDIVRIDVIPAPILSPRRAFKKRLDWVIDDEITWVDLRAGEQETTRYFGGSTRSTYKSYLHNVYYNHKENIIWSPGEDSPFEESTTTLDMWLDRMERELINFESIVIEAPTSNSTYDYEAHKEALKLRAIEQREQCVNKLVRCKEFVKLVYAKQKHYSDYANKNDNHYIMAIHSYETFMTFCEVFDINVQFSERLITNAIECMAVDKRKEDSRFLEHLW